ncbi:MAG: M20 family metallopeptidase [Desulfovermiculus sp.]
MPDIKAKCTALAPELVRFRRDLHQIPEAGLAEHKTAAYVAKHLHNLGLEVHTGIAGTGIKAVLRTGRPGPTLLYRADMDALPVEEQTQLPWSSRHTGMMHACGHDGHMAMALGAATLLSSCTDRLHGNMVFLFQPAEEGPGGAQPMLHAGALEDPPVDQAFAFHLWPDLDLGCIGIRSGPLMAAMNRFQITILGQGGHAAIPHKCVDALDVGVQVVNALQRLVSRKISPLHPAVLTVGSFQAGSTFNVIPDRAHLAGTTRSFDREVWEAWPGRIEQIVSGVCTSMGAEYKLEVTSGFAPLMNDPAVAERMRHVAAQIVPPERIQVPEQTMGGEDMSFILEKVPGCYVFLGIGRQGQAGLHSPYFDFEETILTTGLEFAVRYTMHALAQGTKASP